MNPLLLLLPLLLVPTPAEPVDALAVLRAWDERRAAAWARGDPAALSELYVAGSRTGRPTGACSRRTPIAGCGSPACGCRCCRRPW